MLEDEVEMNEVTDRRRPSAAFLVKILIVLLFPLHVFVFSGGFSLVSIILVVGENTFVSFNSVPLVLFMVLPCLIFNRQLNTMSISKSVKRRAAIACLLTWLISLFIPSIYSIFFNIDISDHQFVYTPILSIAFFVILPLISRETTMRSISSEHRELSYRFITSTLRKRFRREKALSGLLWAGLVFGPFVLFAEFSTWSNQFPFTSLFYQSMVILRAPFFPEFEFTAVLATVLPVFTLMSALRFVFVRDVFRFQRGHITKSRLVSVALLGEILPSAVITLTNLVFSPPGSFFYLPYPLPILPVIGFAFIRFSKFVPVKEELWTDYEHKMWFEKERDITEPMDESIKVPIAYLLRSRFRKRLKE
ncbi:MAG: hypothetical protein ACW979_11855 [Candidatus Thorarchaeota archaeon]